MQEKHQQLIELIKQADNEFDYEKFVKLVQHTGKYAIEMQSDDNNEALLRLSSYVSAHFFNEHLVFAKSLENVLFTEQFVPKDELRHYYNAVVEQIYLDKFMQNSDYDEIKVTAVIRYNLYSHRGNYPWTDEYRAEFKEKQELTYIRYKEQIAAEQEEGEILCEYCGSPIDVSDKECWTCDAYVYVKYNEWMLHDKKFVDFVHRNDLENKYLCI